MGISAALGGAAGALISPIMTITPSSEASGRQAFVVAILEAWEAPWRIRRRNGSGIGRAGRKFLFLSVYQEAIGFIVLVIVLIFRPQGIIGKRSIRNGLCCSSKINRRTTAPQHIIVSSEFWL